MLSCEGIKFWIFVVLGIGGRERGSDGERGRRDRRWVMDNRGEDEKMVCAGKRFNVRG
jgi:hypothetical protein